MEMINDVLPELCVKIIISSPINCTVSVTIMLIIDGLKNVCVILIEGIEFFFEGRHQQLPHFAL